MDETAVLTPTYLINCWSIYHKVWAYTSDEVTLHIIDGDGSSHTILVHTPDMDEWNRLLPAQPTEAESDLEEESEEDVEEESKEDETEEEHSPLLQPIFDPERVIPDYILSSPDCDAPVCDAPVCDAPACACDVPVCDTPICDSPELPAEPYLLLELPADPLDLPSEPLDLPAEPLDLPVQSLPPSPPEEEATRYF